MRVDDLVVAAVVETSNWPKLDQGSWPAWISAVITSLAALVAVRTYWSNSEERRYELARVVYATVDSTWVDKGNRFPGGLMGATMALPGPVKLEEDRRGNQVWAAVAPAVRADVTVHNLSKELLPQAYARVTHGGKEVSKGTFVFEPIAPGASKTCSQVFPSPLPDGARGHLSVVLYFRDARGKWWKRVDAEPVKIHRESKRSWLGRLRAGLDCDAGSDASIRSSDR